MEIEIVVYHASIGDNPLADQVELHQNKGAPNEYSTMVLFLVYSKVQGNVSTNGQSLSRQPKGLSQQV